MGFYSLMKTISQIFLSVAVLLVFLFLSVCAGAAVPVEHTYLMYVGTYTEDGSKSTGIYAYRYDPATAEITSAGLAAETVNPSFLAVHPNHRFLYAVNEVGNYKGQKSGAVSAFAIDRVAGKLTLLNQVASKAPDPSYIILDKTGTYALLATYTWATLPLFPVAEDGRLGEASAFVQH